MRKNVLITGAARRIGAACARLLHERGCNIIVHYHCSIAPALQLCRELNALRADSAIAVKADLTKLSELQNLVDIAQASWQGVDVLVNNAAQFFPGAVGQVGESDWDLLINSNLKAPFFLAQALAPVLTERRGCIINIVDIYAERSLPGYPVYSITKAGLVAMTQCLAKELAPAVRVNAVAPGAMLWPEQELEVLQKQQIIDRVALQHIGQALDIAQAVSFLIAEADYITGHTLTVDGGRRLFI
ncbi:pteridine reductase [Methylomonas paludis]|uniref:Pteridine reductase n=1 Tax=Methylomonas paludis TaxID=1173101 RepID=A0A975MM73_9GAMM|nr:pteridine reductase [Methylomonas paludis]QWF70453.1 pteridine reductase [Methylomonas paludis]